MSCDDDEAIEEAGVGVRRKGSLSGAGVNRRSPFGGKMSAMISFAPDDADETTETAGDGDLDRG